MFPCFHACWLARFSFPVCFQSNSTPLALRKLLRPFTSGIAATKPKVTIDEVNRVLEVGRLLFSVLTEEEIAELQRILNSPSDEGELGNAGVT
jgi:hypothetical protein